MLRIGIKGYVNFSLYIVYLFIFIFNPFCLNSQKEKQSIAMKNASNSKARVKSVPQNFGYTKKSNGSATATEVSTNAMTSRTAAVSAVPRTNKLAKVSGGTQTTTNDFQQSEFREIFIVTQNKNVLLFTRMTRFYVSF